MKKSNYNSVCSNARLWYYDYLCENKRKNIPHKVLKHIISCQYCQKEIKNMESLLPDLIEVTNDTKREIDKVINTIISTHLTLVDIPVTCDIAKPFIPRLTDPLLQITIPTPINVHLDNCQACTDDFNKIRNISLNHEQLGYLGQIFADASEEQNDCCMKTQSIASMDFHRVSPGILKHICTCEKCRKEMLLYYQKNNEELVNHNNLDEESVCRKISMSDIANFYFHYGIGHISDASKKDIKSLESHIQYCPVCRKKILELINTVDKIVKRPNSDVITKFSLGRPNELKEENTEDIYSGWPINVQVINKATSNVQEDIYQPEHIAKEKLNILPAKIRKYAKTIAAAAVILLAVTLFFYSSSVKAVDISQIYKALKNVNNVYISRLRPDSPTPFQEEWISRSLKVIITKTQDQYILWDIQNNVRIIKSLSSDSVETIPLPSDMYSKVEQSIEGVLSILPFQNQSQVPKNSKWYLVQKYKTKNIIIGTSIYELIWTNDANFFFKCRFFIDNSTYLVQKTEYYFKQINQEEYVLESIEEFKYINDSNVEEVLKNFQTTSN